MSEKEKEDLNTIMDVIPKLSEFQRGRLYGMAERIREEKQEKEAQAKSEAAEKKAV